MSPKTSAALAEARAELGDELADDIDGFVSHVVAAAVDRPDAAEWLTKKLTAKAVELPLRLQGAARLYSVIWAGELLDLAASMPAGRA